ncbi:hypothetical protein KFL_000930020 [Klebsormidium nitens]|uniref:Uncharacterized protein n=1 Tax=Klebsormidium nitens TaxID=105231 RepID=A0A1Y1HZB5_KLENI|nr:hypothetical protein KFL_000930020 [Klebsormidium nitens]|eukprot:GAQ81856.1 hypothetical protein KFL_000930020 [Klebsormidium nitens]
MARGEWVQPDGQRPSTAPASGRLLGKTPRGSGPPALQIDLSWNDNPSATNSPATQKIRTPSSTPARNPIVEGIDSPKSTTLDADICITCCFFHQFRSSVRSFTPPATSPEHQWRSSRAGRAPASPSPIVGTPGDRPTHLLTVHGAGGNVALSGQNRIHRKAVPSVPASGSTLEFGASSSEQAKPMRKPAPPPSNDLAGSPTPRGDKPRGPKQVADRPQDNREEAPVRSKQLSEYSHLNKKRDPLGQYGYQGVESATFKPQIKRTEYSGTSHIEAGTVCTWRDAIVGQASPRTRCMATGEANPALRQSTAARTMGYGDAQGAGEGTPRTARPQSAAARDHVSEVFAHKAPEGISPRDRMIASRAEQRSTLGGRSETFSVTVQENAQAFASNKARLAGNNNIFGGFLYEQK